MRAYGLPDFQISAPDWTEKQHFEIKATVPAGASSGAIQVSTPGGLAMSGSNFTVDSSGAPTITGFSPASALAGADVTR